MINQSNSLSPNGHNNIQNSKHATGKARTLISNPHVDSDSDKLLLDFIRAKGTILDQKVLDEIKRGSKQAITEALNQIHGRSIRTTYDAPQKEDPLKYWFLLEGELTDAIAKGNSSGNNLAWAKINYLKKAIQPDLLIKCLDGDEESLCDLHRYLMNEGWWERVKDFTEARKRELQ